MPVVAAFFLYLFACMLLSAVLLPWLQPIFEYLLNATPDRALYRFGMLLTLLGLPVFLRLMQLRGRDALGFAHHPQGNSCAVWKGLGAGVLILAGLEIGLLLFGAHHLTLPQDGLLWLVTRYLFAGLFSGLAVGLIEEFFFRGAMHTGARRTLGFWPVALLTGAFYSAVHFMRPVGLEGDLNIAGALQMLFGGLERLDHLDEHADRFIALLIVGIFLSMVRERTGSIWWPIGLHAGWVLVIKLSKKLTDPDPQSSFYWLISADGITGWWSIIWLSALGAVYWWWSNPKRRTPA